MSTYVLDCSVALAWCFENEASDETDALLVRAAEGGALVPNLWHLEVANALLMAERRGRLNIADVTKQLALLSSLPLETDQDTWSNAWPHSLLLARNYRLTSYDAAYLELAGRRGVPLATKDEALAGAACLIGVAILP